MIHPTDNPAFLMRETSRGFVPLLFPFRRKNGTWIEILSCINRSAIHAMKCALKWLDREDLICRRLLAERSWGIQPLPYIETHTYDNVPDELFDTEDIYDD